MSERDDKKKQLGADLTNAAVQAATAGGGTLVTGGTPLQAAVVSAFGFFAGLVPAVQNWRKGNQRKLLSGYSPVEDEQAAADRLEDAATRNQDNVQTIVEILKSVEDTIDPNALPILGKLLRSYTDDDRPFDLFARGFSRFLRDLDHGDVDELQGCWLRLLPVVAELRADPVKFTRLTLVEEEPGIVKVQHYAAVMQLTGAKRLFKSLVNHGLAEENYGGVGEAAAIKLWFDVIERIAPYLEPRR